MSFFAPILCTDLRSLACFLPVKHYVYVDILTEAKAKETLRTSSTNLVNT